MFFPTAFARELFAMPAHDAAQLAALIETKRGCLEQLRELTTRQLQLIERDELGQLLHLLAVKQRLLGELQAVERTLDPFRDQKPEERQWSSPEQRARCAQAAAECDQLLRSLLEQEKLSESQLSQRRDAAAGELKSANWHALARDAYAGDASLSLGQLDLVSDG